MSPETPAYETDKTSAEEKQPENAELKKYKDDYNVVKQESISKIKEIVKDEKEGTYIKQILDKFEVLDPSKLIEEEKKSLNKKSTELEEVKQKADKIRKFFSDFTKHYEKLEKAEPTDNTKIAELDRIKNKFIEAKTEAELDRQIKTLDDTAAGKAFEDKSEEGQKEAGEAKEGEKSEEQDTSEGQDFLTEAEKNDALEEVNNLAQDIGSALSVTDEAERKKQIEDIKLALEPVWLLCTVFEKSENSIESALGKKVKEELKKKIDDVKKDPKKLKELQDRIESSEKELKKERAKAKINKGDLNSRADRVKSFLKGNEALKNFEAELAKAKSNADKEKVIKEYEKNLSTILGSTKYWMKHVEVDWLQKYQVAIMLIIEWFKMDEIKDYLQRTFPDTFGKSPKEKYEEGIKDAETKLAGMKDQTKRREFEGRIKAIKDKLTPKKDDKSPYDEIKAYAELEPIITEINAAVEAEKTGEKPAENTKMATIDTQFSGLCKAIEEDTQKKYTNLKPNIPDRKKAFDAKKIEYAGITDPTQKETKFNELKVLNDNLQLDKRFFDADFNFNELKKKITEDKVKKYQSINLGDFEEKFNKSKEKFKDIPSKEASVTGMEGAVTELEGKIKEIEDKKAQKPKEVKKEDKEKFEKTAREFFENVLDALDDEEVPRLMAMDTQKFVQISDETTLKTKFEIGNWELGGPFSTNDFKHLNAFHEAMKYMVTTYPESFTDDTEKIPESLFKILKGDNTLMKDAFKNQLQENGINKDNVNYIK